NRPVPSETCLSPSLHARASRAILLLFPCNGNRRDLNQGKFSSDTNYTNSREMVGRVTPVRAEIVWARAACRGLPALPCTSYFSALSLRRITLRAILPAHSRVRARVQLTFSARSSVQQRRDRRVSRRLLAARVHANEIADRLVYRAEFSGALFPRE